MGEIHVSTPNGHVLCDCDPYDNTPVLIGYQDSITLLDPWDFTVTISLGKEKVMVSSSMRRQTT